MADKKISELDLALLINNDAEFPFSQDNAGEPTTFKGRITQLGTKIAEDMTFSNLQTTSKKLVGAINELLSLGNPIILGTSAPTSSQGANGNLYVQYTAGTGGADDEVDGIYVKIDGAWCEISTGGGSGTTDYVDLSNKPQVNSIELVGNKSLDDLGIMPASLSKTVSGSIAHFTDGADNIPVNSLVSQIVAVESGSGEKSPDNPYTISGFDSGVVSVCGKNLLSLNNVDFTLKSVRYYTSDGNFYLNGTSTGETSSRDETFRTNLNFLLKAGTYYFSCGNIDIATYLYDYEDNTKPAIVTNSGSFTLTEDTRVYIGFYVYNKTFDNLKSEVMVNIGSTTTTFEAYNGNTYTFTFGQTVYGGYFDNKGNLVVTKIAHIFDGTESFISLESGTVFAYDFGANTLINSQVAPNESLSTHFIEVDSGYGWNSVTSGKFLVAGNRYFGCNPNMSLADYKTFLANQYQANTPVKAICLLANPITLAITSQDIPTLLGENNIFSNCGDVEVNYYTDNADEIVEVAKATASTPLHNYSTDEQIVGTWIDGSTLYEKTVVGDSTYNQQFNYIPHGVTNLDKIIDYFGYCIYASNEFSLIPYLRGATYITVTTWDSTNIRVEKTGLSSSFTGVRLVIRYTKSST